MMHILLLILKIIGMILLVAVCILLLALLLILLCPVVYRGRFRRTADTMAYSVSISWLFCLVWFTASYEDGKRGFRFRLFGIPLDAVGRLLAGRGGRRKASGAKPSAQKAQNVKSDLEKTQKVESESQKVQQAESEKKQYNEETKGAAAIVKKQAAPKDKQDTEFFLVRIWRSVVAVFKKLTGLPGRIVQAVRSFFQKISDLLQKIRHFRELLWREEFFKSLRLLQGCTGKLLRHVRPRKLRGWLKFGFDDPAYTGLSLGAVSVIYPWYHKTFTVEPDFQSKILEADLYLRGRVFGAYALYIFIKVYFDKNIKYMMNSFRDKEA